MDKQLPRQYIRDSVKYCKKVLRHFLTCGKKFMQNTQSQAVSPKTKDLIDKLLLGKLSLPEIAKVTGVSEQWIQSYVNSKYEFVS
jgi:predicted DNA-binding protein YlxM (UPF0122 family)